MKKSSPLYLLVLFSSKSNMNFSVAAYYEFISFFWTPYYLESNILVVLIFKAIADIFLLGSNVGSSWGISSIFGGSDNRSSAKDNFISKPFSDPVQNMDHAFSMIYLREVCVLKALSAV